MIWVKKLKKSFYKTKPHVAQDFLLFFSNDVKTISLVREDIDGEGMVMIDPYNNMDN